MTRSAASADRVRRRRWEVVTAAALLTGYAGYYVCRSNLSVVAPQLLRQFGPRGLDRAALGFVASAGAFAYAGGKLVNGVAVDLVGGRRMFLIGMIGSIAATLAFGASGSVTAFAIFWSLNRFVQSMGWSALVKVASHWFAPDRYGTVMAVLSLSFLFGDAAGRVGLGTLVAAGAGWRLVFAASALTLAVIAVGCAAALVERPADIGLDEPAVSSRNVFGGDGGESRPNGIADVLGPYFRSRAFWLVCLVSLGLTLVRESFNTWTPTFLVDTYGMVPGEAGRMSALFPFVGGVSVIVVGAWSDHVRTHRLVVAAPLLAAGVACLIAIGSGAAAQSPSLGLMLLSAVAFFLIGPYSLLAGAIAAELGGRRGSATAAGLIDTAGYLGAVAAGAGVGLVADRSGWPAAFRLLALVTALSAGACVGCWLERRSTDRAVHRLYQGA